MFLSCKLNVDHFCNDFDIHGATSIQHTKSYQRVKQAEEDVCRCWNRRECHTTTRTIHHMHPSQRESVSIECQCQNTEGSFTGKTPFRPNELFLKGAGVRANCSHIITYCCVHCLSIEMPTSLLYFIQKLPENHFERDMISKTDDNVTKDGTELNIIP